MKRQLILLLALLPLLLAAQVGDLPRSTPAAEGISTQAVINMMDSLMSLDTASSSSLESPQSLSLCLQPISGPRRDWKPSLHFMRGLSGQRPEETQS